MASRAPSSALSTPTPTPCGRWTSKRLALPSPHHPRRPLALRPRPGRLCQPAHRHRARPPERLPDRLLVDNGSLTVWLIAVSHSRPYHPQTLGKDERFHGTLQRDLGGQPPRPDLGAWQTAFDAWRHEYNHVRPHESLALAVPATRYHVSPRPYPAQLPPLPYGPDDQVRRVQAGGWVSFQGREFRLPKALRGQPVALRPTATDGCWAIRFLSDDLGTLDLRDLA